MSDRIFTDCCYGTDQQHTADQPCPHEAKVQQAIDAFNEQRLTENIDGRECRVHARRPILATDCDYEIVRFSGVQGVNVR